MLAPSTSHPYIVDAPEALPFGKLTALWIEHDAARLRPATQSEYIRILLRDVLPRIGTLPADQVKRLGLIKLFNEMKEENGKGVARNAKHAVSAVFNWGIAQGKVDCLNPTQGIKLPRGGNRKRWLSEEELRIVWHACEDMGDFGRIVRLLMLTACRCDEIAALEWPEVSWEKAQIVLLPERVKNGSRTGRGHIVPLSRLALDQLPEERLGSFVFGPDEGDRKFTGWAFGRKLPKRTGPLPGGHWVLHDLRHTFSTHMREKELATKEVIEAMLNHAEGGMAGVYNHAGYAAQRRRAAEAWSALFERITR